MLRARTKIDIFPADATIFPSPGKVFIGISLNNKTMQSVSLLGTIFDWTMQNVGTFDLLIGDYLNRYNYEAFEGEAKRDAIEKARRAGDEARKRLAPLTSSPSPFASAKLISTAELCRRPSFEARREHFRQHYTDNADFRAVIQEGVDAFLTRRHPEALSDARVRDYCVEYQLEELVMFEQLAQEGYGVFVYPGAQLPIMKSLVTKLFGDVSPDLQRLVLVEMRIFEDEVL